MEDSSETLARSFRATVDAETIQRVVAQAAALVDECRVELDETGIRIRAVDPASVALVDVELGAEAFERYEADGGCVGIDLERFEDVVDMAERGQPVELTLDPETRTMEVHIGDLAYTLGLLDPEVVRSPPEVAADSIEFTAEIVVAATEVDRALGAADMVSDHVAFGVDPDEAAFYVEATGDVDDVSLTLPESELVTAEVGDAESLLSLDYLKDINRAIGSVPEVGLQLGPETPLWLGYEFAESGSVEYVVSPRIRTQ